MHPLFLFAWFTMVRPSPTACVCLQCSDDGASTLPQDPKNYRRLVQWWTIDETTNKNYTLRPSDGLENMRRRNRHINSPRGRRGRMDVPGNFCGTADYYIKWQTTSENKEYAEDNDKGRLGTIQHNQMGISWGWGMMNILLSWDDSALYSNEIDEDMENREDKGWWGYRRGRHYIIINSMRTSDIVRRTDNDDTDVGRLSASCNDQMGRPPAVCWRDT